MSRLLENGKEFRDAMISKNTYNSEDNYHTSHSRAKSDGDEHGKGELDGSVGGKTDILTRNKLESKNRYNKEKEYNQSNA